MDNNEELVAVRRQMLADHLARQQFHYLTDEDGDFVLFTGLGDGRTDLTFLLCVEAGGMAISVRCTSNHVFSPKEVPAVLLTINAWHAADRWPQLVLRTRSTGQHFDIAAEGHLPAGPSMDQDDLDSFVSTLMRAMIQFWTEFDPPALQSATDSAELIAEIRTFLESND